MAKEAGIGPVRTEYTLPVACFSCGTPLDSEKVAKLETVESKLLRNDQSLFDNAQQYVQVRYVTTLVCVGCKGRR